MWTSGSDTKFAGAYRSWVYGYLSGIGAALGEDILANMNADGVASWLDRYCRANPSQPIATAALMLAPLHGTEIWRNSPNRGG